METELQPQVETKSPLMKVTPLSKYLAMVLFIVMPFVGGWIGYEYSPEKVIEVNRVIYRETEPVIHTTNDAPALENKLSPYDERSKRVEHLKSSPMVTIDTIYDFQSVVPFGEQKIIYEMARKYVTQNSAEEMNFSLVFNWKKGEWINFTVIPENIETDNAQLFMEKESGQWTLKGFGTAFPDLYKKHPELFDEQPSPVAAPLNPQVNSNTFRAEKFELYTDPNGKFAFEYPVSWSLNIGQQENGLISLTNVDSLPSYPTESLSLNFDIKSFKDFYTSAIEHEYLDSVFDHAESCRPIVIDGFASAVCSSAVSNGVVYIIPLIGHVSSGEALYIRDGILNDTTFAIINSLVSLVD